MSPLAWISSAPVLSIYALRASTTRSLSGSNLARREEVQAITNPDNGDIIIPGESPRARTIYTVISLFCMMVLAAAISQRFRTLKRNAFMKRNITHAIVLLQYFFGIAFIFSAGVVETGQGLRTHVLCYSAAIICLVFYTGNKLFIYIFLLERAHVVRAPFVSRSRDWLWLGGMVIILAGFGTIAIIGYLTPIVELSNLDGRCRIGLPAKVSFPLLSFDVAINFMLTGVFFVLLWPVVAQNGFSNTFSVFTHRKKANDAGAGARTVDDGGNKNPIAHNIKILLRKSLIGSTLVMLPTVANMTQFYVMKGREMGWICLTICTLDVSWGVLVVNWLTFGSAEAEQNLTRSVESIRQPLTGAPSSMFSSLYGEALNYSGTSQELQTDDARNEQGSEVAPDVNVAPCGNAETFLESKVT